MRKEILQCVKATFPLIMSAFIWTSATAQQWVIVNKDNTRPETNLRNSLPARITNFDAARFNGYNELRWTALGEQDTRRFVAEYSADGVNYESAGELAPVSGTYSLKHHILSLDPLLYRIRIETTDGRFVNSENILLDGARVPVVAVYPTAVTGQLLQVKARFPVERAAVTSMDGTQLFAREVGGADGNFNIALPTMQRGMYLVTFYGNGWKSTSKFLVNG